MHLAGCEESYRVKGGQSLLPAPGCHQVQEIARSTRSVQQLQEPAPGRRQGRGADWWQNEHELQSESLRGLFGKHPLFWPMSSSRDRHWSLQEQFLHHNQQCSTSSQPTLNAKTALASVVFSCSLFFLNKFRYASPVAVLFPHCCSNTLKVILAQISLGKSAPPSRSSVHPDPQVVS